MASNDITLQDIIIRLDGIDARLDKLESRTTALEQTTATIAHNVDIIRNEQAHMQHTIYWGFAIMGIVVALMGLVFAGVALFFSAQSSRKEDAEKEQRGLTVSDVLALMNFTKKEG